MPAHVVITKTLTRNPDDEPARKYWFPTRRYGWGWGPPTRWEGWLFLVVWLAVFGMGSRLRETHPSLFVPFVAAMIAILLTVCFAKGERPRWRWGDRDDKPPRA